MRKLLCFLVLAGCVLSAPASSWFDAFPKFTPSKVEIVWTASATNLPPNPWVYGVLPQKFSGVTFSNLLAITGFKHEEKADDSGLRYVNKERTRSLTITPENGCIQFLDQGPELPQGKVVEGVPSTEEAEKRALSLLNQLGIASSELAKKTNGNFLAFEEERTTTHFDKKQGKRVSEVYSRGVSFVRQVDGIPFAGIGVAGGFDVRFGLQGKLAWLELVWRNLRKAERCTTPTAAQITKKILGGGTYATHGTAVDPNDVRKLTITEVTALYTTAAGGENQTFVYPFIRIQATAETVSTNAPVQLYCPITSGNGQ